MFSQFLDKLLCFIVPRYMYKQQNPKFRPLVLELASAQGQIQDFWNRGPGLPGIGVGGIPLINLPQFFP